QRNRLADLELGRELLADVERDRHRPQDAAREPHLLDDGVVVGTGHEAFERRERAVQEQLDVAELTHREIPGAHVARSLFLVLPLRDREIQILQFPSVGFLERSHDLLAPRGILGDTTYAAPPTGLMLRNERCTAPGNAMWACFRAPSSCPCQLLARRANAGGIDGGQILRLLLPGFQGFLDDSLEIRPLPVRPLALADAAAELDDGVDA